MPSIALILKNLLFTIVAPGTAVALVPYLLLRSRLAQFPIELGSARIIGLIPIVIGVFGYLWCLWDFMKARGTPAPIDAPKELVVKGLYRYARNPMYVSFFSIIIGEAIYFETGLLLLYVLVMFLIVHTWVILYEEPALQRLFGPSYERYRRQVGRWLPVRFL